VTKAARRQRRGSGRISGPAEGGSRAPGRTQGWAPGPAGDDGCSAADFGGAGLVASSLLFVPDDVPGDGGKCLAPGGWMPLQEPFAEGSSSCCLAPKSRCQNGEARLPRVTERRARAGGTGPRSSLRLLRKRSAQHPSSKPKRKLNTQQAFLLSPARAPVSSQAAPCPRRWKPQGVLQDCPCYGRLAGRADTEAHSNDQAELSNSSSKSC